MDPRISLVTLGVADLSRATRFYEECLGLPRLETPPSVTFFEMGKTWLALWSRESLAEDAGVPSEGGGFRGFALAHNVRSQEEVDALLSRVAEFGAEVLKVEGFDARSAGNALANASYAERYPAPESKSRPANAC